MNKETFDSLKTKTGVYAYSSFEYLEYEHAADYHVVTDSPEMILISGRNNAAGYEEACWAADNPQPLIEAVKRLAGPILVTFIPEGWKAKFHEQGFKEYGILREYWIDALQDPGQPLKVCAPLAESEYAQAAAVTVSCRDQSREFHGETAEWIAGWMRGEDPDASACGSRDYTILACRKNGQPVGVVCVAIYGDKSAKGPVVWIREISVMPEYQGQGCGKALLQSAISYGLAHGAKRAFLMADDCNTGAIALYRRMGFEPNMSEAQIDLIYEATDV